MTTTDPVSRLMADAATILAGWPRLRARLHAVHVPGPDGRCRGCPSQVRRAPVWPCAIAALISDTRISDTRNQVDCQPATVRNDQ